MKKEIRTYHVGRPNIGDRMVLLKKIERVLNKLWLTNNGPLLQELESRLAEYFRVKNCVAPVNAHLGQV